MTVPVQQTTARLVLRKSRPDDAEAIFEAYATDAQVPYYMTWRPHAVVDETRAFIDLCLSNWTNGSGFAYAITESDGPDRPIGMIDMRRRPHEMQFGYVLARPFWGQGYATEALTCLVAWSLSQPDIWRSSAFCDVDNRASARVMEKSGMSFEGILARYCVHPNISDAPRNCRMYAKVR